MLIGTTGEVAMEVKKLNGKIKKSVGQIVD